MELPIYSMGEQPVCCPICGARTEWEYYAISNEIPMQHHICMNDSCQYRFLIDDDDMPI